MHEDQKIARALKRRYIVALILIALLASTAWLSMQLVIAQQESNAAIVNVSGRQRMLSQRTALFSTLLIKAPSEEHKTIRKKLSDAASLMETSHLGLTHGNEEMGLPSSMSETVRSMYFNSPLELNKQVETYLGHIKALLNTPDEALTQDNPHFNAIISTGPTRLVITLDKVVNQYQREGEEAVQQLQMAETAVWIITLILLTLEAFFIFKPITRQIRSVILKLELLTDELTDSKKDLEKRVQERTEELERIAHFDPLTGIPNRRNLLESLNQAIAIAKRQHTSLAVCYIDLDGFKPVNDIYGHATGDKLLKEVAMRLKHVLRLEDNLARLGGDEFILLLGNLKNTDEIAHILDRVLEVIRNDFLLGDITVKVSASIGVTLFPEDAADSDTLIRHADQAMYKAKSTGKNCFQFFDPLQDQQLQQHQKKLQRLSEAVANGEFVLHYQPKVNMRTGKLIGVEALLRWQHPERGLLLPGEFLSLIENHPLATQIGEWVIDQAMIQIELWKAADQTIPVSVNLDAIHIEQPDFIEQLTRLLSLHPNVCPADLELEVLETSALEDIELVAEVIRTCHQLGVGFALDDFGTGYSTLLYLKKLPAELLKIDQGFVKDMLDDPEDMAILEGVLGLAIAFQRNIIAEGVETEAHGEMLLRMNCELGQGYAIARPMPAEELADWIENWRPLPSWVNAKRCSRDNLPVLFAMVEHRAWIVKVTNYIEDKDKALPQLDHTQCRFGKWLIDDGAQLDSNPYYDEIINSHREAHDVARQLIEDKQQGNSDKANLGLRELYTVRDRLLELLTNLI